MRKTLGGDRLGSGNKMKVDLKGFSRSTFDKGYVWRSTISAGPLVPCMCEVALPGDTWDINLGLAMNTLPTIGPLLGSYKAQIDVFLAPIRLYNSLLHNNALKIGNKMHVVKFPVLELKAWPINDSEDKDNAQINPSSLLSYLGIRGVGDPKGATDVTRTFNAVPYLAYHEIYKQYYANKQEEVGAVIHTGTTAIVETITDIVITSSTLPKFPTQGTITCAIGNYIYIHFTGARPNLEQAFIHGQDGRNIYLSDFLFVNEDTPGQIVVQNTGIIGTFIAQYWDYRRSQIGDPTKPNVILFDLDNIDNMRKAILSYSSETAPFNVNDTGLEPYIYSLQGNNGLNSLNTQQGLLLKTYQSDLFNNWLQTEQFEEISSITAISTASGEFTIDTLNLAKKVYDMLNRIAVSGGTYDDWVSVQWDHNPYTRAESPIYCGGLIKELVFQEVVSTAATLAEQTQPLGTLGGKGVLAQKHKGGRITIKVDEPSYIIALISLTPRVDYSQGTKWHAHLQTMNDLHVPILDQIGFQDLITEQMAWWDTTWNGTQWVQKSAGKQPAWINYMTSVNETRGNFAYPENQMFMTLNRRYEHDETNGIKDLTTYIDPSKFNYIFAETSLDAQNFWVQIAFDATVRRKMSSKIMPNA